LESERSKSVLLSNLPGLAYRCNYDPDWTMQFVSAGCLELTGYLKIDRYFINKLLYLKDEEAIIGDIISMVHKQGHCVVAEGVEHESQLRYLIDHGCGQKKLTEAAG
jgi:predicted signal transduction protein with EAL and GGDEF domain